MSFNMAAARPNATARAMGSKLGNNVRTNPMPRRTTSRRKPAPGTAGPRSGGSLQADIDALVRRRIGEALTETTGNVVHAARILGVSQPGLYKRLVRLGIDPDKYRR